MSVTKCRSPAYLSQLPSEILQLILHHAFDYPQPQCHVGDFEPDPASKNLFRNPMLQISRRFRRDALHYLAKNFIWMEIRSLSNDFVGCIESVLEHATVAPPSWKEILSGPRQTIGLELRSKGDIRRPRDHRKLLITEAFTVYHYHTLLHLTELLRNRTESTIVQLSCKEMSKPLKLLLSSEVVPALEHVPRVHAHKSDEHDVFDNRSQDPVTVTYDYAYRFFNSQFGTRELRRLLTLALRQTRKLVSRGLFNEARWLVLQRCMDAMNHEHVLDNTSTYIQALDRSEWYKNSNLKLHFEIVKLLHVLKFCAAMAVSTLSQRYGQGWSNYHFGLYDPHCSTSVRRPRTPYFGLSSQDMADAYYAHAALELPRHVAGHGMKRSPNISMLRRLHTAEIYLNFATHTCPDNKAYQARQETIKSMLTEQVYTSDFPGQKPEPRYESFTDLDGQRHHWYGDEMMLQSWTHNSGVGQVLKYLPRAQMLASTSEDYSSLMSHFMREEQHAHAALLEQVSGLQNFDQNFGLPEYF